MSPIDESNFSRFSLEPEFPKSFLVSTVEFTEFDKWDTPQRGYRSGIYFEHEKKLYPIHFYDPVRLSQDLTRNSTIYDGCIAEPGNIVIHEVTLETMIETLKTLLRKGYFDFQKNYTLEELCKLCGWWDLLGVNVMDKNIAQKINEIIKFEHVTD